MKILVIDDSRLNLEAAKAQFKGDEVHVIDSYREAEELLRDRYSESDIEEILKRRGVTKSSKNYWNEVWELRKVRDIPLEYDAVLVDLLLPASNRDMASDKYVGQEMPIGIFLALLAAKRSGPKYVAVLTSLDHHQHPGIACIDYFNEKESRPIPFKLEGTDVLLTNCYRWSHVRFRPEDLATPIKFEDQMHSDIHAKNWRALLDYMCNYKKKV